MKYEIVAQHTFGNRQEVQTTVESLEQANVIVKALADEKFTAHGRRIKRYAVVYAREKE